MPAAFRLILIGVFAASFSAQASHPYFKNLKLKERNALLLETNDFLLKTNGKTVEDVLKLSKPYLSTEAYNFIKTQIKPVKEAQLSTKKMDEFKYLISGNGTSTTFEINQNGDIRINNKDLAYNPSMSVPELWNHIQSLSPKNHTTQNWLLELLTPKAEAFLPVLAVVGAGLGVSAMKFLSRGYCKSVEQHWRDCRGQFETGSKEEAIALLTQPQTFSEKWGCTEVKQLKNCLKKQYGDSVIPATTPPTRNQIQEQKNGSASS